MLRKDVDDTAGDLKAKTPLNLNADADPAALYALVKQKVPVVDRVHHGRSFSRVFVGNEAVDVLEAEAFGRVHAQFGSRFQVVAVMQALVDAGYCYRVMHPDAFHDKQMLYRWYEDHDFVLEHGRQVLVGVGGSGP